MNGSLFFVDEEKTESCEICSLREHAESSDRLESIQENEDYIVWIVKTPLKPNEEIIKILECYAKKEKVRKELLQFEGGFTDKGIHGQSKVILASDQICCKESAVNYAGEIFLEREKRIGYDGTGETAWTTTKESWEWTSIDAGTTALSVLPLNSFDELPSCLSEYLTQRQEMLAESEKMMEKLKRDGFVVSDLPVSE